MAGGLTQPTLFSLIFRYFNAFNPLKAHSDITSIAKTEAIHKARQTVN
jgi:hypothetical protein